MEGGELPKLVLVFAKALEELKNKDWDEAMKTLYAGLVLDEYDKYLTPLMARQFAELKFSNSMSVNEAVYWETFLFSKVSPNDWLNASLGLASEITKCVASPIGNVVPIVCQDKVLKPFIISSNTWCALCYNPNCTKLCSGCKKVYYCSGEHQKLHWAETHRLHCNKNSTPIFFDKSLYKTELKVLEELYKKESKE